MAPGVLIAVGTADFESDVLGAAASAGLQIVRRCVDVADLLATAASRQAQVALVSMALAGMDAEVVARLSDERVAVVGIAADESSPDAVTLRRLGVHAVVAASRLELLAGGVGAALSAGSPSATSPRPDPSVGAADSAPVRPAPVRDGKVVAIWGATGAPGRSTLSLGLAACLAANNRSTLLVDADVYGGSQGQLLGLLDESSGLLAAAREANRGLLDVDQLASHARSLGPALRLLSGLPRSDRWVELAPVLLERILDNARALCGITVVDCAFCVERDEEITYDTAAPRRNGATLTALETADRVVVVGAADPVGLGRLLRALSDLTTLVPTAEPWVVVNRMRPSLGWSEDDVTGLVRRTAQTEVAAFLPDDPGACDRAVVQGQTLAEAAPASRLTKALRRLSVALAADLDTAALAPTA